MVSTGVAQQQQQQQTEYNIDHPYTQDHRQSHVSRARGCMRAAQCVLVCTVDVQRQKTGRKWTLGVDDVDEREQWETVLRCVLLLAFFGGGPPAAEIQDAKTHIT